ncbi:hypothetical protein [Luteibacter yeojuensis]|uniref:hypothetical protein n=1 Tax=Luteibacter yeojuensis TaxID=345309 RepID=UPI000AB65F8B|nr:hypothetical protein [Luteibacter yeojuensis]
MTTSATQRAQRAAHGSDDSEPSWSDAYARFLSGSLSNAQKTLQLYQQSLECVASGRLPPTIFQEYYPRFVQRHGAAYGERLSQLFAGFMGRFAELNKRNAAFPADGDDAVPPPVFEAGDPARWLEQYAEYAGKLNARAVKAYRRQLDQVAEGALSPEDAQRNVSEDMSRGLEHSLRDAGQLYLQLLLELDGLRGRFEGEYLAGILALAADPSQAEVTAVVLEAPAGGVAFQSFTLENTTDAPMPVRYMATEVRRMDGVGQAFAPKVMIAPEVLELAPGEAATIRLSMPLEADRFEVGIPYVGFLYVMDEGERRVDLQLRIVASAAAPKQEG